MRGARLIRGAIAACATACAILAACADLGNLSGGGAPDAAPDAAAPPPDAPGVDAADADSGVNVVFVDEFERAPASTLGEWDTIEAVSGAVSIDSTTAASGASSLGASVGGDAGAEADLRRAFTLPATASAIDVTFAIRIESLPPGETHVAALTMHGDAFVFLNVLPSGFRFAEQKIGATYADYPFGGITPGAWHTLRVQVDASKTPSHAIIDVDGTNRLDRDLVLAFSPVSPLDVRMGIVFVATAASYSLHLDNVRIGYR